LVAIDRLLRVWLCVVWVNSHRVPYVLRCESVIPIVTGLRTIRQRALEPR